MSEVPSLAPDHLQRRENLAVSDALRAAGERDELRGAWVSMFVGDHAFRPITHLILTFDQVERRRGMGPDGALKWWLRLVRFINEQAGGQRYREKWSHSYFSYIVGTEFHELGGVHLHVAVDQWIPYREVHDWWERSCGICRLVHIKDSGEALVSYCVKEVVKDMMLTWYLQPEPREVIVEGDTWSVRRRQHFTGDASPASGDGVEFAGAA